LKEIIWSSLTTSLQSGQCVLVLGPDIEAVPIEPAAGAAGASRSVRDAFCLNLARQLEEENQKVGEQALFAVAQQYEDTPAFNTVNLRNIASAFFRDSGYRAGPMHEALAKFPFGLVLTTCHDDLFQRALADQEKSPSRYWYHFRGEPRDNRELESPPDPDSPVVYHLFGSFDEPNSLVLTENDLLDFVIRVVSGRPKLPDSLRSALRNKTFLFYGFGIRHWYIRVLLKLLARSLELTGGSVALESLGALGPAEREQTVLFYRRGTRIEVVDTDPAEFVKQLRERFDKAGGYRGAGRRRVHRAHVFISYERSDAALAQRLFKALDGEQFEPWLDTKRLEGGEDWNDELEQRLQSSDYVLVLNSENLAAKLVGYVNKEVSMALKLQELRQRGVKYLIPLTVGGLTPERGLKALASLQQMPLGSESFVSDVEEIMRVMRRDFQLRAR